MKYLSNIVLFIALVGLLPVSCMDDRVTEEVMVHPDYIGFSSTTTRASMSDLTTLQNDGNGFRVYATGGSNPTVWYTDVDNKRIDGMNKYSYQSNQWTFEWPVKWSTYASDYPKHFYAFHPFAPNGLTVSEFASGSALRAAYTVQAVNNQVDLLAARATANSKPSSGRLTLTFDHILSKVNFGIIAGTGTLPVVQSLQMVNIGDTRTYDFVAGDWVSTAPAISGNASYYYFGAPNGSMISPFTPNVRDESTGNLIYGGKHDKHLILMPQTAPSWSPQSGVTPTATSGAYISVIYRMSTGHGTLGTGDPREVGFPEASQHPHYDALGGGLTGALYVKAGFPLPATSGNYTLEKGKSHLYNIVLGAHGSSNGYILDDYYYDEKGVRTGLQLIEVLNEGKKIGDKLQDGVIHVILDVDYWDNQDGGDISPGTINVSKKNILLSYNEHSTEPQSITVNSLKANGTPDLTTSWTLEVSDKQDWVKISFNKNASFATAEKKLTHTGSQTVYFYTTDNTNVIREEVFFLNGVIAGNIYLAHNYNNLSFVQNRPVGFNTYVGAFWRAGETGERIINIPAGTVGDNLGHWTAYVAWKDPRWGNGNGIKISTERLPGDAGADPNLYQSNPGNAEDYQVLNDDAVVKGILTNASDNIIFRIGLQSTYTPTSDYPARYAVIILSYAGNTKHQKIYLRQGEEADYLMKNGDQVGAGSPLTTRTVARMFSPYNLTADIINASVDKPGAVPAVNPGKFTDYPTQAGAIFQWGLLDNSTYLRWAWNGYTVAKPNYYADNHSTSYWGVVGANNETCPPGYRRPNDGNTSTAELSNANSSLNNSELRQSLFHKPFTGHNQSSEISNSVWGYYADGFFDRHPITNATTVASGMKDVAYIGQLFYNPNTDSDHYNASVFFPNAGYRYNNSLAELQYAGQYGYYWTTSAYDTTTGWAILFRDTYGSSPYRMSKGIGAFIRCVKQ